MIVSNKPLIRSPRWLRALALLGAVSVLPLGLAQAQEQDKKSDVDWRAIQERIEGAVERGEMTREEADKKHAEIRKRMAMGGAGRTDKDRRERGSVKEMRAKISGHLEKQGFSAEQIRQSFGLIERLGHEMKSAGKKWELSLTAKDYMQREIGLTEKQIEMVVGVSRRMLASKKQRGASREEMAAVKAKIWAAVKAGKITEAEAEEKWKAYVESVRSRKQKVPTLEQMAEVRAKIFAAVKAGQVTEAQAEERWQGYLKHIKEMERRQADEKARRERSEPTREEMGEVKRRIWAGVEDGTITEEQAEARWKAYLERVRGGR